MTDFYVQQKNMILAANDLSGYDGQMAAYYEVLENIKSKMSIQGYTGIQLKQVLSVIGRKLSEQSHCMKNMSGALYKIAELYSRCENKVLSAPNPFSMEVSPFKFAPINPNIGIMTDSRDLYKLLGEAGIAGSSFSVIGSLLNANGDPIKDSLDFAKGGVKVVGKTAGAMDAGARWKDKMFGLDQPLKEIKSKTFRDAFPEVFGKEIEKYSFKNAETSAGKVKAGAKWAGFLLSMGMNAYENYQEQEEGKISSGRAVAETISETAVDTGIGMLAAAGVGAGLTALGFVGAPALVVGALAVGAVWAVDAVVRWGTKTWGGEEKGLTEAVSDALLDSAQAIGKGVKKAFDEVSSFWSNACARLGYS